jgi:hypothetical protein
MGFLRNGAILLKEEKKFIVSFLHVSHYNRSSYFLSKQLSSLTVQTRGEYGGMR